MGDKILEVNGHSFYGMTHAEAVTIMRNAWNLIMYLESPTNSENPGWHGGMVFHRIVVIAWSPRRDSQNYFRFGSNMQAVLLFVLQSNKTINMIKY